MNEQHWHLSGVGRLLTISSWPSYLLCIPKPQLLSLPQHEDEVKSLGWVQGISPRLGCEAMGIQGTQKKITFAGLFITLNSHSSLVEVYSCWSLFLHMKKLTLTIFSRSHLPEAEFKPESASSACAVSTHWLPLKQAKICTPSHLPVPPHLSSLLGLIFALPY